MSLTTEPTPQSQARRATGASRVRAVASAVLLTLAVILAPIVVTSVSAGMVLSDTDRFADTFAPVAADPQLQAAVSQGLGDAAVNVVAQSNPAESLEQYLKESGASQAVQLSARYLGSYVLQALETAVRENLDAFVSSEQFAQLWEGSLRTLHHTMTTAVGDQADTAVLRLDESGTLWLNSTVVAQAAVTFLETRTPTIVEFIPTEGIADVRIAQDPAFAQVRTAARSVPLLITVPLVALAVVLVAGVLLARRRWRALAWTAGAASLVMVLYGIAVGSFELPHETPEQAIISAFMVPVQGLIAGPAVTFALITACATLVGTAGVLFVKKATPRDAAALDNEI